MIKLDNEDDEKTLFRYAVSSEIKNELIKRCSKRLNIKNKENQKNDFLYEILLNKNFKQIKIKNE